MNKLQVTGAFLGVMLAGATAAAEETPSARAPIDPPATGPRAASARALVGFPPPAYAGRAPMCAGGERVVSSEAHFYSVPLFIAGLAGVAAAPLVGVAVGYPLHLAEPQSDAALYGGFISAFVVLAAGVSLAVVGGHQDTRVVYAVSSLRLRPAKGGLAVSF